MKLTAHVEILPDFLGALGGELVPYIKDKIMSSLINQGREKLLPLIKRRTLKTLGRPIERFSIYAFLYSYKEIQQIESLLEQSSFYKTPEGAKILEILKRS